MPSFGGFEARGVNVLVFEPDGKPPFIKIVDIANTEQTTRVVNAALGGRKDADGNPFVVTRPADDAPNTLYVEGTFPTDTLAATSPLVVATAITGGMVENGLMDAVNGVNMIRRTCSQADISEEQLVEALRKGGYIRTNQQIAPTTPELPAANQVLNLLTDKEKPMAGLQDSEPVNVTLFETAGSAVQGMKIRPTGGTPHRNDPVIEITADAHTPKDSATPTSITVYNKTNEIVAALNAKEQQKPAGERLPSLRVTAEGATNRVFVEGFANDDVGRVHAGAAAATLIEAYNHQDMLSTPKAMVGIQKLADEVLIDGNYEATAIGRLKPDTTIRPESTQPVAGKAYEEVRGKH